MVFDHNYIHDTCSQGLFLKDGDETNVTVTDNLFIRNATLPPGGCSVPGNNGFGGYSVQIFNAHGLVMRNNTEEGTGSILRAYTTGYDATVDHNVFSSLVNYSGDGGLYALTENHNIFGSNPYSFTRNSTDIVNASPTFANTSPPSTTGS